jgi:hypothetical protein
MNAHADDVFIKFTLQKDRRSKSVSQNWNLVWSYGVRMPREKPTVSKRVRENQYNRIFAQKMTKQEQRTGMARSTLADKVASGIE